MIVINERYSLIMRKLGIKMIISKNLGSFITGNKTDSCGFSYSKLIIMLLQYLFQFVIYFV